MDFRKNHKLPSKKLVKSCQRASSLDKRLALEFLTSPRPPLEVTLDEDVEAEPEDSLDFRVDPVGASEEAEEPVSVLAAAAAAACCVAATTAATARGAILTR